MIVTAPGSSSNLGPGFDCLGIAWKLYDRIAFEPANELVISGCDERFRGPDNLAYQGFAAAFRVKEKPVPGVRIEFLQCDIPVSRGLGSSAALLAAGAAAANETGGLGFSREELLAVCTKIEGHPDNLAPVLFGGFTAALKEEDGLLCASYPLSERLRFLAVIPDFELSTASARAVMPKMVSLAAAVRNLSRSVLLADALEKGDMARIRLCMRDEFHQPYRLPLIPGAEEVFTLTEALGGGRAAACISGAGSTLLLISDDSGRLETIRAVLAARFTGWKLLSVEPETQGLQIL